METVHHIDTVYQYNQLVDAPTLHPLVSVVDFSVQGPMTNFPTKSLYGIYAIFLKDVKCGDLRYGRNYYDYQEGTIVCIAPGQVLGFENKVTNIQPKGWALVFHPDLIRGTSLGQNIKNYSFFSYEVNEALHVSEKEREVILDCIHKIETEISHDIDTHSNKLIARNIELLLDYCDRFYDRQFITRHNINEDVLSRFEQLLNDYFAGDRPQNEGLPTVKWCAEQLYLSPNYFGDLIKKLTGITAQEHIQEKVIEIAKEKLFDSSLTIGEIAYRLGFKYPPHFTRLFKQRVGCSPNEYRAN